VTDTPRIRILEGDLFESEADALVNTVNTVGVMGKGVALAFRKRFPEMYADYVQRCEHGEVELGRPYIWRSLVPPAVINFPTKGHWRAQSRLVDIERGLVYLQEHIRDWGVQSLAVPPLGCGEGGLEWRVVGPLLYEHLRELGIPVELYAPFRTPHAQLEPDFLAGSGEASRGTPASRVRPAAVALVAIVQRLRSNPFQAPVGRTFFQKLAYFATERGLPTGLTFRRGSYGPYAEGLKPLIGTLVNNGLLDEVPSGRMLVMRPGPTFSEGAKAFELSQWRQELADIVDLASRMDTRQAEVAATVHFVAQELLARRPTARIRELEVVREVLDWKARRQPPFHPDEVASATRHLALLGWLDLDLAPEVERVGG
jgi:O-acetyl-ADP-ribose deacetylase (regulator of RNase III)/uncharacterized protein YwgA